MANRYSVVVFLALHVGNSLFANAIIADGKEVDQVSTVLSSVREGVQVSLEFCEDVEVGVILEELLTTSKLLCSTYLKIKGICSLKALKFKRLK